LGPQIAFGEVLLGGRAAICFRQMTAFLMVISFFKPLLSARARNMVPRMSLIPKRWLTIRNLLLVIILLLLLFLLTDCANPPTRDNDQRAIASHAQVK